MLLLQFNSDPIPIRLVSEGKVQFNSNCRLEPFLTLAKGMWYVQCENNITLSRSGNLLLLEY